MTTPATEPLPRLGRYQVLNKLAQGGMAEIFLAKALGVMGFERLVAIKLIHSQLTRDAEFVKMFIDEARIAMHLQHRNIVQVFDLDRTGDTYFIAMEFVHGVNLYDVYEKIAARGRWFDLPLALYIVAEVSKGLHFAHTRIGPDGRPLGIVHRDISPQNVLLSFEGEVKITDFGIAKAAERLHVTTPGIVKGKYAYMAPEILREKHVDGRADVFAAGVLLYELLVGENPFAGATPVQTIENVLHKEVPAPSQRGAYVSAELDQITLTALTKDPDQRYSNAAEFAEALTDHGLNLTSARRDIASGDSTIAALLTELFPEKVKHAPLAAAPGSFQLPLVSKPGSAPNEDTFPEEKVGGAISDPSLDRGPRPASRREASDSTLPSLGERPQITSARRAYDDDEEQATALDLGSLHGSTDNTDPVKLEFEPATDRSLPSLGGSAASNPAATTMPDEDFDAGEPTVLSGRTEESEEHSTLRPRAAVVDPYRPTGLRPTPEPVAMPVPAVVPHPQAAPATAPQPSHDHTAPRSEPLVVPVQGQVDGALSRSTPPGAPDAGMSRPKSMLLSGIGLVGVALVVVIGVLLFQRLGSPGYVAIKLSSTPPGAQAIIDGRQLPDMTPTEVRLVDGQTHQLEVRLPGHRPFRKDILVLEGVTSEVDAVLEPITGEISLKVESADAHVVVNGVSRGRAPEKIGGLLVGQDVVLRFEKEGYAPAQQTVTLTESEPNVSVAVALEKLDQAAPRRDQR